MPTPRGGTRPPPWRSKPIHESAPRFAPNGLRYVGAHVRAPIPTFHCPGRLRVTVGSTHLPFKFNVDRHVLEMRASSSPRTWSLQAMISWRVMPARRTRSVVSTWLCPLMDQLWVWSTEIRPGIAVVAFSNPWTSKPGMFSAERCRETSAMFASRSTGQTRRSRSRAADR